jgi:hypothetical protein
MDHAWCKDIERDAAVRAAEDGRDRPLPTLGEAIARPFAEAAERSVPVSKTGEGQSGMRTERVTLEVVHGAIASVNDQRWWDNRLWIEPQKGESVRVVDDDEREVTVGDNEPWQKAILNDAVSIIVDGGDWGRGNSMNHGKLGVAVIWADKEIGRLRARVAVMEEARKRFDTALEEARDASGINDFIVQRDEAFAERDAAIREREKLEGRYAIVDRRERFWFGQSELREAALKRTEARVAELEAASGGGEGQPDAFGVVRNGNVDAVTHRLFRKDAERSAEQWGGTVVPLYRQPSQPRGWLTEDERELIAGITDDDEYTEEGQNIAKALLARSSPPEVVLESWREAAGEVVSLDDVRAALAAIGVAVKGTA